MENRENLLKLDVNDKTALRDFDELPFYFYDVNRPHIKWICNYSEDGKITSVIINTQEEKGRDRCITFLDTLEKAIEIRNNLIKSGWEEFTQPQVNVYQQKSNINTQKPLNRKQRRMLKRLEKNK